jgi:hypothetical protein
MLKEWRMFCVPLPQVVALGPWSTKSNNEIINGQTINGLIHSLLGSPHYHNSNQTIRSRTIEVKPLEQISQLYDKAFLVIYRDIPLCIVQQIIVFVLHIKSMVLILW